MHGLGFYLGLTALNYGEVEQGGFTRDQWAELLFAMGVQCQFSCACIASLLAVSEWTDGMIKKWMDMEIHDRTINTFTLITCNVHILVFHFFPALLFCMFW